MNQVLEFSRIKAQESDTIALNHFVDECIRLNIKAVSNALSVLSDGQKKIRS